MITYVLDDNSIDDRKNWFKPYQRFISEFCDIRPIYGTVKIEFKHILPKRFPGDEEGVIILPWLIVLSNRVRTCLIQNVFLEEGLYVLFRQIAYVEFWQDNPFWVFSWLWNKKIWRERAHKRAEQLLEIWRSK